MMVGGGTGGTSEPGWTLEAAFTQIQQLLGAVNNLQQTIVQQEQTIAQLQNQPPPPPASSQPSCGPKMHLSMLADDKEHNFSHWKVRARGRHRLTSVEFIGDTK
ncbi:hypothetical protein AMATHDRAFT_10404 [Amanita thiersii Skay4041]|uniref:Uncharacterized protein n=1 Tax=Amanita thiersii Skay4041 TaxID=703135 RepID=A0A2A9NBD4_9AGAR|nr:hypothetical protein AMATHDRAFT_10404 [Amanita thiersii Skay4041]